jgi:hypothetical protein
MDWGRPVCSWTAGELVNVSKGVLSPTCLPSAALSWCVHAFCVDSEAFLKAKVSESRVWYARCGCGDQRR